ncbi:hypothetical protein K4F52_004335 [Lecanicillium sp. MT-2017a]|nr:hypothetical protein K4F52_004335 [Lecanicillium sp. MT-2017a]
MSASSKINTLKVTARLIVPAVLGSAGYAAWRVDWQRMVRAFVTGPGRTSRILLLVFCMFNWKNLPFAWTYRIFAAIIYHNVLRQSPELGPKALYRHMISTTRAPLLEIDYNLHKSNSTYFSDLDASRTHLVSYLCRPALKKLSSNARHKLVLDPKSGKPVNGAMGIMLGSVACSFKREIAAYKGYEMWSRILCWDRKWAYIVTHFVPKGAAKPTEWLDPEYAGYKIRRGSDASGGWESKIHATAISKYVFKLGRLTVNPAVVLEESGLLPERPGGWISGPNQVGDESVDVSDVDLSAEGEWDWRRIEAQRRQGMEIAAHFQEIDTLHGTFDGGNSGAIAICGPG